jgi:hypothetical protein
MSRTTTSRRDVPGQRQAPDAVTAWVAEGIITQDQADRIHAREHGPVLTGAATARPSMMPLVVEALGYLGGAIVVVATGLIAGQYWEDMSDTTRMSLLGAAALLLLVGGAIVPDRLEEVGDRMRSVVWVVSTGSLAGFLGVWGSQVADWHDEDLALLVTAGTAAYATALFLFRPAVLQQVAMMGLIGGTAAALLAKYVDTDSWPGVGFWVVGAAWLVLGQGAILRPVGLARAAGAVMMVFGSMITTSDRADAALVFSLVTVAIVIVLAVAFSDLVLLAIGALGAIRAIIAAVDKWFPNSLAAALALLVVGSGLVVTAIWIARRRARAAAQETPTPRPAP